MTSLTADDKFLIESGYTPQLKRKIGFFSSFAVSFSVMSIVMGIYANYAYMLSKSGPFGIWTWLIVGVGQLFVAFVFADMAGRIPLTGALYNWNDKLGHPIMGWIVAWLTIFAYAIGSVGIIVAMMLPLQSLFATTFNMQMIYIVGVGIFVIQFLISAYGIQLAAGLNKLAVILEISTLVLLIVLLAILLIAHGGAHSALIFSIPTSPVPYAPAFLMASLLAAWTIFGFESPSDLSEETLEPKRIASRSIVYSVLTTIVLGFLFIVVLTIAIPDLDAALAVSDPISFILESYFGKTITDFFLLCVVIAMFACSLVNISVAARILFAVSRDKRFFAHSYFRHVSSQGVPLYAVLFIALIEIVVFLAMYGLSAVYASAVVLLFLAYLITIFNFLTGFTKLPKETHFSLGIWRKPVSYLALTWLIIEIGILTIPTEFHLAAGIAIGVLLAGIFLYSLQKTFLKN